MNRSIQGPQNVVSPFDRLANTRHASHRRIRPPRAYAQAEWMLCAGLSLFFVNGALPALAQPDAAPIRGELVRDYAGVPTDALILPTDVAVAADGTVYIADGVHDRIAVFSAEGDRAPDIRGVGALTLSRPMGIAVDVRDNLWIADTGNGRIIGRAADGALLQSLTIPHGAHPADVTDLVLDPSGVVWFTDNDNHRIGRWATDETAVSWFGQRGTSLGQFDHPFMIAAAATGDLLVTDVINGRVHVLAPDGRAAGTVARYGVEAGELFRPKGIACDRQGRIWVSDGVLGVVQVFQPSGTPLGLLHNTAGQPLRFENPMGLVFDAAGDLYVVESTRGRVRRMRVTIGEPGPSPPPLSRPQLAERQPHSCTVCHVEWMAGFTERPNAALIDTPVNFPGDPYVSRAEACLSCHDGSVVDSRKKVWIEHGHRKGVIPPDSMNVPPELPLVDGAIACRTCHSAHSRAGSGNLLRDAVFLRVSEEPNELCLKCHADLEGAPGSGLHPTHRFPAPLPSELLAAGARAAPSRESANCMACHAAHASGEAALLVRVESSDRLCLSCHEQIRPDHYAAGNAHAHPIGQPLSSTMRAALADRADRWPAGEIVGCRTCHKVHHGHDGRNLLAEPIADSALCLRCHSDQSGILEGPHRFADQPDLVNALGRPLLETGACAFCHSAHSGNAAKLWAATSSPPQHADALCTSCHRVEDGFAGATLRPLLHHTGAFTESFAAKRPTTLPLFDEKADLDPAGGVSCATCHDVHAASTRPALLRSATSVHAGDSCTECHPQARNIHHSMHAALLLPEETRGATQCAPCHTVHAPKGPPQASSAMALLGNPNDPEETRRCTGCHRAGGPAAGVRFVAHPALPMVNTAAPGEAGFMPLVDPEGRSGSAGVIGCVTCHLPHGRETLDKLIPPNGVAVPTALLRAAKPMLRAYQTPNLCSSCHGFEGLQRFLYFHRREYETAVSAAP